MRSNLSRTIAVAAIAASWAAASGVVQAQTDGAASLRQRSLAASCAQCHGTDGRPAAGSSVPPLAGRSEVELVGALGAFKAGTRPATVMTQLARGYSDAQIRQLAATFAAAPR